ncbi:SdpI family protein [Anaerostipes faecalis]|uniref:SdpI family protein n=1 Tax=Anaerostipes faecalis TaxID=2738446 RepID=UPI003F0CD73E
MKIKNKRIFIIFILSLIVSIVFFFYLPDKIPTHWNIYGEIDHYGSKFTIFMEPALIFILWMFMDILRKADPKRKNYQKFEKEYEHFKLVICLLMFALQIFTIAVTFGVPIKIDVVLPFIIGFLLAYVGNMMPKIKFNYFMGIKTPWTLNSEEVWFRTHRFAGKLWFIGGILAALSSFLPGIGKMIVFTLIILIISITPMVYSCIIFKS